MHRIILLGIVSFFSIFSGGCAVLSRNTYRHDDHLTTQISVLFLPIWSNTRPIDGEGSPRQIVVECVCPDGTIQTRTVDLEN